MIGADPEGSVLSGDTARPYLQEGIGEDFFPGTYDPAVVDRWVRVSDRDAFAMARRVTREEGILAGESTGTAVIAALDEARRADDATTRRAPREAVFVVILPDGGRSYMSKLYNDEWMRANGLLATTGAVVRIDELLERLATAVGPAGGRARPDDPAGRRGDRDCSRSTGSARCRSPRTPTAMPSSGIVGSINEKGLLDRAYPRPVDRRTDRRRGDGAAAAARGRVRDARRGVRPAERRRAGARRGRAASSRPAS